MIFTFAVLVGDLGMTPVHGVILPSTFPARFSISLLGLCQWHNVASAGYTGDL